MQRGWFESLTDLQTSYKETRNVLRVAIARVDEGEMVGKEEMAIQAKMGGQAAPNRENRGVAARKSDKELLRGMLSDCEYTLEWLRTGRTPGNRRGIERLAGYQREKLVDPMQMQAYVQRSAAGSRANLADSVRERLDEALACLTERERDCYVLKHGECRSYSEIAELLGLTKSSIQAYVTRAQRKLSKQLEQMEAAEKLTGLAAEAKANRVGERIPERVAERIESYM